MDSLYKSMIDENFRVSRATHNTIDLLLIAVCGSTTYGNVSK